MPNIQKPKAKRNPKGEPPKDNPALPLTKRPSNQPVPLNFTVENQFRREFKMYAVQNDMPMVDLLKLSFEALKQQTHV